MDAKVPRDKVHKNIIRQGTDRSALFNTVIDRDRFLKALTYPESGNDKKIK